MSNPTADFPNSIHSSIDVSAFSQSGLGITTVTHTELEGKQESELVATQLKLGAGSGAVAASGQFFMGIAPGSSGWVNPTSIPITGSGLALTVSGTAKFFFGANGDLTVIGGNIYISGNYLTL